MAKRGHAEAKWKSLGGPMEMKVTWPLPTLQGSQLGFCGRLWPGLGYVGKEGHPDTEKWVCAHLGPWNTLRNTYQMFSRVLIWATLCLVLSLGYSNACSTDLIFQDCAVDDKEAEPMLPEEEESLNWGRRPGFEFLLITSKLETFQHMPSCSAWALPPSKGIRGN